MLKNPLNKISYQILLSYAIPLMCLCGLCVSTYNSARKTFSIEIHRDQLNESKDAVENASYHLIDSIRRIQEITLSPKEAQFLTTYQSSYDGFIKDIEKLNTLAEKQQDSELLALNQVFTEEGERIDKVAQRILLSIENNNLERATSQVSTLGSDTIALNRDELIHHLEQKLEENLATFTRSQNRFKNTLISSTILATIATLSIGWLLTQRIRHQIKKMVGVVEQNGIQVTTSSTQIAASSRQLEASVSEQVASTHQITATTAEIAATAEELNHTIGRVVNLSESASHMATQGKQDLEGMASMIQQLTASTATISAKLGQIDDKANNISAIVTTITKVADQTNLLSLNAAIEAEKAGEYGSGFSVVAREIRRLADQTAIATLDIENMVKEMLSSVSAGVMEMDKFTQDVDESASSITELGSQMAQIIHQVQSIVPQFEIVRNGMSAQAQGAQQIRAAMEQLNDTSQQTAESVQDTNQVISQLGDVAKDLQSEVAHFRLAV
ncbi:MAG: methyl-accepting chemotaxis protein [Phormidesmis sp.]